MPLMMPALPGNARAEQRHKEFREVLNRQALISPSALDFRLEDDARPCAGKSEVWRFWLTDRATGKVL
jgi:hypothetical protein